MDQSENDDKIGNDKIFILILYLFLFISDRFF
jgi:hypothetical protein